MVLFSTQLMSHSLPSWLTLLVLDGLFLNHVSSVLEGLLIWVLDLV